MLTCCAREQIQNARENPLAAAAAAAAVTGATPPPQAQNNAENLLDIDFDGTAPASAQKEPDSGLSGLEGLAGTPVRVSSPAANAPSNNLDDLLGVFGDNSAPAPAAAGPSSSAAPSAAGGGSGADLLDGLGGLDIGGNSTSSPPPASATPGGQQKKTNEDILSLF